MLLELIAQIADILTIFFGEFQVSIVYIVKRIQTLSSYPEVDGLVFLCTLLFLGVTFLVNFLFSAETFVDG